MKYSNYNDLKNGLKDLPVTWYPALIIEIVMATYKKRVFISGGASKLIEELEKNFEYEK